MLAAARSGALDELSARHGLRVLTVFGGAARAQTGAIGERIDSAPMRRLNLELWRSDATDRQSSAVRSRTGCRRMVRSFSGAVLRRSLR